jgi:hypothetical protein
MLFISNRNRKVYLFFDQYIADYDYVRSNAVEFLFPKGKWGPEVRVRFQALPDFLRSSGSGTGSTQPCEYN